MSFEDQTGRYCRGATHAERNRGCDCWPVDVPCSDYGQAWYFLSECADLGGVCRSRLISDTLACSDEQLSGYRLLLCIRNTALVIMSRELGLHMQHSRSVLLMKRCIVGPWWHVQHSDVRRATALDTALQEQAIAHLACPTCVVMVVALC
jgi:hypothetical protein